MWLLRPWNENNFSSIYSSMVVKSTDLEDKSLSKKFCYLLVDLRSNLTLDQINLSYSQFSHCKIGIIKVHFS